MIAPERINCGYEGFSLRAKLPKGISLQDFLGSRNGSAIAQIIFAWDSFYNQLNQKFLEYDYKAQRDFFNFSKFKRYTGLILFVICLAAFVFLTLWWRRGLRGQVDPVDKMYLLLLKKLKKAGIDKTAAEGAYTLEKRLPADWSSYEDGIELLRIYRDIKYAEKIEKIDLFLTKTKRFHPVKIMESRYD